MDNTILINGIKGRYNLGELRDTYKGQKLLEKAKEENLDIMCICLGFDKGLPLHVRQFSNHRSNYNYTLVRNANTMELHHKDCPNFGIRAKYNENNIKKTNELVKNKKIKDDNFKMETMNEQIKSDGKIRMSLNTDVYLYNIKKTNNMLTEKYKKNYYDYVKRPMYLIGEALLFNGWRMYIENINYNNIPTIKNVFYNIYFNKDLQLILGKDNNIKINDIIFKPLGKKSNSNVTDIAMKAFYKIHNTNDINSLMYLLGKLKTIKKYDEQYTLLTIVEPFKDNYIEVLIDTNIFKLHWELEPKKADKYISCFVYGKNEKLYISSLAIIPILKDRGISVNSNYEVELAEQLIEKQIFFIKSPKSYNAYKKLFKDYKPDFLLLEKRTRKIVTIFEVFGFDKHNDDWENYWKNINKKIKFYKSLKQFNFLYWNAYEGRGIPPIYQPIARR